MDPQKVLLQAGKAIEHVRSGLNDQWNFHGLYSGAGYGLDGLTWCTSHYAFHMALWHILFAVCGQYFSAPNATLLFDSKFRCPYKISFLTPFAIGTLKCVPIKRGGLKTSKFEILSTSGDLHHSAIPWGQWDSLSHRSNARTRKTNYVVNPATETGDLCLEIPCCSWLWSRYMSAGLNTAAIPSHDDQML